MPQVKIQEIATSLYVCLPKELMRGDQTVNFPPLELKTGDVMVATRTRTGILFEPRENMGSTWVRVPINQR